LGYVVPTGSPQTDRYHPVLCRRDSVTYLDTKWYDPQTLRLYVSTIGNDPRLLEGGAVYTHLENVQTHIASGTDCARYQACRLLSDVCYMAHDNSDCVDYEYVCGNPDDADQVARLNCIPECVFTYWPERIDQSTEIDSEGVINCMAKGCGIKGSSVDGMCKNSTIVGLAVALALSLLINVTVVCLSCNYKGSLKNLVGTVGGRNKGDREDLTQPEYM